jgi:hypothetical protein
MTRTAATLTFALAAVAEVQAAGGGYALVAETQHFSFYAYTEHGRHLKVDAKRNERALLKIADQLGVAPPERRIVYYRHEYPEEVAFHVGQPSLWAAGVADPNTGTIHTVMRAHPHEIVHLVAFQVGDPGRFFHEGLAVALGDKGRLWGQPVNRMARRALRTVSITEALSRFEDVPPEAAYPVAGSFVAYLIKTHGIGRVSDFFRRSQAADPGRAVAFEQVFGAPLGEIAAKWRATL